MLSLGADPSRIVYAHTCKQGSYIKWAAQNNVSLMTFDNEDELHKTKKLFPQAQ